MKKNLFILAAAGIALASCSSDDLISENAAAKASQPVEIAFNPIAQPSTRANAFSPVSGTAFPDNYTMNVSANLNAGLAYFTNISFSKGATTTWKGDPAQYWPLSASTLNFLAVTNWTTTPASVVSTAFTNCAQTAVVTLGDNKPTDLTAPSAQTGAQHDLMYAVGRGIVTQSGNVISYTGNSAGDAAPVDMQFKHALAWVNFTVKTEAAYTNFKLRYIKLNGAYYGGTYTLDNSTNYIYVYDGATYNSRTATPITGVWSSLTNQGASIAVPGWTSGTDVTTTPATVGNGLVVVPTNGVTPAANSFTGFEIGYTFNGQDLTFTYAEAPTLEQAKKYTYAINFKLTEIEINPSVADWTPVAAENIDVPATPAP